jgi:hypothetical protein
VTNNSGPGARRSAARRLPGAPDGARSAERTEAERAAIAELEAWRSGVLPDPWAAFDAETLAHLVRSCYSALGIDGVGEGFTVNTVHYYRRKDILDEPAGRTSAARYDVRHLWQAVGARLAGHLGLVTLAEARAAMRGAGVDSLLGFVAARVVDGRARQELQQRRVTALAAAPVANASAASGAKPLDAKARPLPGVRAAAHASPPQPAAQPTHPAPPVVIPLPDEAWCIVPASHPAHRSAASARQLVHALASAFGLSLR